MDEVIVTIEQGRLRGKIEIDINGDLYYAFLGIPYAKPPIGNLRFKAPQPPEKWLDIRDATSDGSPCYSREFVSRTIIGSEDCLFLNVYTPELPKADNAHLKPVMVYIHGGAFVSGSNSSQMYGPQFLITGDVVLVILNYRLGFLGFLAFDDPNLGVPGNAGCKDTVLALKWVQLNIERFGGDPSNVTVFGESAGAAAVHLLVLSPMATGLFHRAILQSGSALNSWCLAKPSACELAQAVGCPYTKSEEILRYLQELPVEKIFDGQDRIPDEYHGSFIRSIGPVIEKVTAKEPAFLSENPLDIISKGNYNNVPLIIGYTAREGIFMEMLSKNWNSGLLIDDFETVISHLLNLDKESKLSRSIAEKIRTFYLGEEFPHSEDKEKLCLVHSDTIFIRGIYDSVKCHVNSSRTPLYFYRFSLDAGLNFYKKYGNLELTGASHADDLGYLFKTFLTPDHLEWDSIEFKSVRRMVALWTNFAKTGNPNPVEGIVWKSVSADELNFLDIDVELRSSINPDDDRMKFWDEIYEMVNSNIKH